MPDKKKGLEFAPNGYPAADTDLRKMPMVTDLRAGVLMAIWNGDRFEEDEKPRIQEIVERLPLHYPQAFAQNTIQNTLDDLAGWPWPLINAMPDNVRPTQPNRTWIVYSLHHGTIRDPRKARLLRRIHFSYHQNPTPSSLLSMIGSDVLSNAHRIFESLEKFIEAVRELLLNGYIINVPTAEPDPEDEWFQGMDEVREFIRANPNMALAPLPRTESEIRYIELLAAIKK